MLTQFDMENFALFNRVCVTFVPGLNILTGESGAGKSLALEALAATFGGRLPQERIGPFGQATRLRATLALAADDRRWQPLIDLGFEADSVVIVERQSGRDGRSSYRVQGQPVPASAVRALGENLFEYVGQNQLSRIFSRSYLLDWIDAYGGLQELAEAVQDAYRVFVRYDQELRALVESASKAGDLEDRRLVLQELEDAKIEPDEDVKISQELTRLKAGRHLLETGQALYQRLDGSVNQTGVLAALDDAYRLSQTVMRYDSDLTNVAAALSDALKAVGEARLEVTEWLQHIDLDPARLEELETRADILSRLKRRYGPELGHVLDLRNSLVEEIKNLENIEWEVNQARRRRNEAQQVLSELAHTLSSARQSHLETASHDLTAAIRQMEMPTGHIGLTLHRGDSLDEGGGDVLAVNFSASEGQVARPIVKVASGGEIARVALALAVTGHTMSGIIFVFDEVDQGLGGTSADRVGWMLRELGARGQVLAVSHQAVVAARAHRHLRVLKRVEGGQSISMVGLISSEARVAEIARMLSGSDESIALAHAKSLLEERTQG